MNSTNLHGVGHVNLAWAHYGSPESRSPAGSVVSVFGAALSRFSSSLVTCWRSTSTLGRQRAARLAGSARGEVRDVLGS